MVCGLWTCPPILAKHTGSDIRRWYLSTFGLYDFLKLGLFAATAHGARLFRWLIGTRPTSFKRLAQSCGVQLRRCQGPNDPRFIAWLRDERIDVLIILVSYILKEEVLSVPRFGTINKHSAVLPANKGLFPYFWARLNGTPQGVSFHEVVRGIDEGRLVLQYRITDVPAQASMVAFYWHVFRQFPERLADAVESFVAKEFLPYSSDLPSTYFGLPKRQDVIAFRKKGGRVIRWRDILLATRL